jgi:hypothetical protein
MKGLFDPVVNKILGLIAQQIQATQDESRLTVTVRAPTGAERELIHNTFTHV